MNAKNVLVNFVGLRGGGVSYAYEMVNGLAKNGCQIYAIVSSKMEGLEKWRSIRNTHLLIIKGYSSYINFIPNLLFFMIFEWRRIKKVINSAKIDFAYIPMSSYWCPFVYNKTKEYRTFFTMHDVIPHGNKKSFAWRINNYVAKKADDIIILSDCFREKIISEYKKTTDRVLTLQIGQQNYYFSDSQKTTKDENFYIIFYGRILDYKGLDILLEAFHLLEPKYKNIKLVIAGSGDLSKYNTLLSSIDESNVILMNRWIKDEEVPEIFNHEKSITVLPYKNATQSGVIPIAMMAKSLVICSNCAGLAEQVADKHTGFIIEPNNSTLLASKLSECLSHWAEMIKVIENAHHYINDLTWDAIAKRIIERVEGKF